MNGGEAEIVDIDRKRVRFRDADGREFNLAPTDPQLRHLDHAYCSTVHAAQGRTARAAIAVLDAGGAADRELFHVELSRVSHAFLLLTDDREALVELLEAREGIEDGALEALGVDPAQIPAGGPGGVRGPGPRLAGAPATGRETSTLPFFLPGYRETMARAAALAEIEDLPADMRRFVDTMLVEHEAHLARDREVEGTSPSGSRRTGGAGRSSAGRPGRKRARWKRSPDTPPGARTGRCFWRKAAGSRKPAPNLRAADSGRRAPSPCAMPGGLTGTRPRGPKRSNGRTFSTTRSGSNRGGERFATRRPGSLDERPELEDRARQAHPSRLAPPTVLEDYAGWSARADAVTERWRAMGGDTAESQAHLEPSEG